MRSDNHYARMSDEYGSHNDHSRYPNAYAHKKNPNIIESYDPNEVKPKIGEGARVSDAIGAHYRDPNYRPPRGGVPLSNHAPMPEIISNKVKEARAREAAARAEALEAETSASAASRGAGPGGLDFRGDDPENYGKYYTNGYEFEGYYQGLHAGKKSASSFSGGGMVHKDVIDPYEGYRGGVNRLAQRPLPKHNDMDVGVLASMKPHGRVPKPVNEARGRLESFTTKQAIDSGRGVGGVGGGFLPGATLGDVGVSKKSLRASRPSDQTMRAVVPGVQEGSYRNGPASKKPGQYYEHPSKGNIEVGGVNGLVAKSEAQFDGIFDENRRGPGHRPTAESHMHFEGGVLVGTPDAVEDGIFRREDEGRQAKPDWKQDAYRSSLGMSEGGLVGREGATHDGIFEAPEKKVGPKRVTAAHVDAYGSGVDKSAGASSMSWAAEASRGRGGRSTEEGEGFFAEGAHTRGGHVGKRLASNIAGGATFQTDPNATDEGIFDEKRSGARGGHAGKDGESSIGPGFAIRHNKGDEGIFDETRRSKFSGKSGSTSIEVSEGGLVGKKGTAIEGIFADGPRKNKHAGRDAVTHIRGGDGGFYGVGAVNEGIFAEGPRKNKHAGRDSVITLGPGFIPKAGFSDDGIFADGPRKNAFAGKDSESSFGPDFLPREDLVDEGIFKPGPRRNLHAGEDTKSSIKMEDGVMMGDDAHTLREDFASAYSELHAHKDTEDHFDPGMIPQVQWKGGGGAQAAYDRRKELKSYYDESRVAAAEDAASQMGKLNFHRRNADSEPAAGLPADRFHREGNALVRTKRTI